MNRTPFTLIPFQVMLRIRSGNEMEKLLDSQNMGQNKKYKSIRIMKNGTLTEDP